MYYDIEKREDEINEKTADQFDAVHSEAHHDAPSVLVDDDGRAAGTGERSLQPLPAHLLQALL